MNVMYNVIIIWKAKTFYILCFIISEKKIAIQAAKRLKGVYRNGTL